MFTRKLWLGVFLVLCSSALLCGQEQEKVIKHTKAKPTSSNSGQEMYMSYCAVCHGENGKGRGPAADALNTVPADLTVLAQKNDGKFPAAHFGAMMRGDAKVGAHGTKEMPVWGPVFWQMGHGSTGQYQLRIANLTKFVESLQAK
jgi:mono/diheme cytochrome c family protein